MYCIECKAALLDEAEDCPHCGEYVFDSAEEAAHALGGVPPWLLPDFSDTLPQGIIVAPHVEELDDYFIEATYSMDGDNLSIQWG